MYEKLLSRFDEYVAWGRTTSPWKFILATAGIVGVSLLVIPFLLAALPVVLLVAFAAGLVMFAEVWVKEFRLLMDLKDDVFQGNNDKLIWAILLIGLPPVGVGIFRAYRLKRWPESKPACDGAVVDLS